MDVDEYFVDIAKSLIDNGVEFVVVGAFSKLWVQQCARFVGKSSP
jgi:hypothetical protein